MYYCKNCDRKVEDQYRLSCSRCPYCKKFMCRATSEGIVLAKSREYLELHEKLRNLPPDQRELIIFQLKQELIDSMLRK